MSHPAPLLARRSALVVLVAVTIAASATSASVGPASAAARQPSLSPADRAEIGAVLDEFVRSAVRRDNAVSAYALTTSSLRSGTTRSDWRRGDIPVVPYPARGRRFRSWTVDWADRAPASLAG